MSGAMIPRTVQVAKAVAAAFTPTQLADYGNVVLNGYATTGANTTGKLAWQYKETLTPPVPLPSLTSVQPVIKGWTTNYAEYYTKLSPNGYGVNPGDPTGFNYSIHSFSEASGNISTIGGLQSGSGYVPGTYTGISAVGGSGTGATLTVTVDASGLVASCVLVSPGNGYTVGDGLTAYPAGGGSRFAIFVTGITSTSPAGQSKWARPPHRFPATSLALYPVSDSLIAPPVDTL